MGRRKRLAPHDVFLRTMCPVISRERDDYSAATLLMRFEMKPVRNLPDGGGVEFGA